MNDLRELFAELVKDGSSRIDVLLDNRDEWKSAEREQPKKEEEKPPEPKG